MKLDLIIIRIGSKFFEKLTGTKVFRNSLNSSQNYRFNQKPKNTGCFMWYSACAQYMASTHQVSQE
jgi:hypothetical protein